MIDNKNIIRGSGGKGGGGSSRVAKEAPNTLQSKAILRVAEVISEGEIIGLVDGAKSIYFDKTPLQNPDGSYNFIGTTSSGTTDVGVDYEFRVGTPDQSYIPGLPDVQDEVAVGVKVTHGTPIVRTVSDLDADAVRVTLQVPALTEQNTSNGDLNGSSVAIKIEYQPSGGSYTIAVEDTITGKTTSNYQRAYRINLTGNGPWNIKVTRVSEDSTGVNITNDVFWSSYTRILDIKMIYPDTALIGLEVDSQLFGQNVPVRAYEIKGKIIQVPSNYDPETRVYTGVWDGTFQWEFSDNPAWVLYDLMTNSRYGVGQYIDATEIDKFALYTIAQYCDEFVDDGAGGTEPRFTFNYSIDSQEKAFTVLQSIASTFRGMLYWGASGNSGVIVPVADMPKDPIKIFTNANVVGGLFTYSGTAFESSYSAVWVTWNDPELGYERNIEIYEDPELIETLGYKKIDLVGYGCTSRGQARRMGKWYLQTQEHESELVGFNVGIANADLRPGDVIKIYDQDYAEIRYGGRTSANGSRFGPVYLDQTVTLESGKTYSIDVILDDGTLESFPITDGPGDYTYVNIYPEQFSGGPNKHAVWGITASDVAPRQFVIVNVKEAATAMTFEVTAKLYDPDKFARVEQDLIIPELSFAQFNTGIIGPPSGITINPYLAIKGITATASIDVSWSASTDPRVTQYALEAKRPGNNNYELIYQGSGLSSSITDAQDGNWNFRVRSFDSLNRPSAYVDLNNQTVTINGTVPPDVDDFSLAVIGDNSILSWSPVVAFNLSHYEIRYNLLTTGATWEGSQVITYQAANTGTSVSVPSAVGTFLIKAVTLPTTQYPGGIYSANATLIQNEIDPNLDYLITETLTEDPDFDGNKTNVEVAGDGNLELTFADTNVYESEGTYEFHDVIDLEDVYVARLKIEMEVSADNATNIVDDWPEVDDIVNWDGETDGQWQLIIYVATTNDDPGGSPTWSEWTVAHPGDYVGRGFKFKAVLKSLFATVTPSITSLSVSLSMPALIQKGEDILTDAGGTAITFDKEYNQSDVAISIAAQDMATGDRYAITSKSETGFTIRFYNSGGTGIAKTFDYVAKGYGYLVP